MISNKSVIAIIPARGGSKGLPGKNIRVLCGKPLIAWTIEAGLAARVVDDLIVSTDSEEIAEVARRWGAEVPFMRPAELATDTATSISVVEHALAWLCDAGRFYEYLVLLEPTSPLHEPADIDSALQQMLDVGAKSVVSVCRAEAMHPAFMYRTTAEGRLAPFLGGEPRVLRRQDIEPVYYLEGTVYASQVETLLAKRSFYHEDTLSYEVPKWKSPEIDDEIDFLLVEAIMRHRGISK